MSAPLNPSKPVASTADRTPPLPGFTCGLDATLKVIAGKWKPLILYFVAQGGPTRYGALRRAIRDVSDKVLIQQLKELEADGLVKRTDHKEVPPRVDYSLTPLGLSLAQALVPLCTWGADNLAEVTRVYARREAMAGKPGERQARPSPPSQGNPRRARGEG